MSRRGRTRRAVTGAAAALVPAAALVLAAALAGCAPSGRGGGGGGAEADCAWVLTYAAHTYAPLPGQGTGPLPVPTGAPLGTGTMAGCDDGSGMDPDRSVTVSRLRGVDPAQAVVTQDGVIGVRDPRHPPGALRPAGTAP